MRKTYIKPLIEVQPSCMQEGLMLPASKEKHTDEALSIGFNGDDWEDEESGWTQTHWDQMRDVWE
ncbi:MAG: hypothetical protein J6Y97_08710 [Prevotella sp.]|nr:hypothetical protein [Prevotella sp.]